MYLVHFYTDFIMSKIFYLLPSILIAGKLIASDPDIHPGYNLNDDLSSAKPLRIPATEQPALPTGTPTTIFPIDDDLGVGVGVVKPSDAQKPTIQPIGDPGLVNPDLQVVKPGANKPYNPVVNPVSDPSLFDDALGGVIRPANTGLAMNNKTDKPSLFDDDLGGVFVKKDNNTGDFVKKDNTGDTANPLKESNEKTAGAKEFGEDSSTKKVKETKQLEKPSKKPLVPAKPTVDESDDDSIDSLVDGILGKNSSDEQYSSDEDEAGSVKKPSEESRLSIKPQGLVRSVVGYFGNKIISCCSTAKNIICFPFKCFLWYCGYDSATTDKKNQK